MIAPSRSLAQRLEALERANDVRMKRARLKRDIAGGRKSPEDMLEDPPDEVLTMKVIDLLLAMPKVGRVKANKWLLWCKMSPSKTLGGMTERQRRALAVQLRATSRVEAVQARDFALN